MNPWQAIGNTVGWVLLVALILILALVLGALALDVMRRAHEKFRKKTPQEKMDKAVEEATQVAQMMYHQDALYKNEKVKAFREGAFWALHYHRRNEL